jgi:hypothetical protein
MPCRKRPLSPDTPLDVERIWLARIRELGPLVQLRRMAELTHIAWEGARQALRRLHPDADEAELDEWLLRERYGEETAREVVEIKPRQGYYDRTA